MLEADYIFLHTLLESGDPGRLKRACTEMMRYQKDDGSWSLYPGRSRQHLIDGEVLLFGQADEHRADDPRLMKAREWILAQRRRGRVQHVHQDVSLRAGPVRL